VFVVHGEYDDLVKRLFQLNADATVTFGPAKSKDRLFDLARLTDWTPFRDYIMDAFVGYSVRIRNLQPGLFLEIRLNGTNRDQHVASAVKTIIQTAGLEPIDATAEMLDRTHRPTTTTGNC
jgi:hypothetical protein